jgi:hypothetical protein
VLFSQDIEFIGLNDEVPLAASAASIAFRHGDILAY